MNDSTVKELIDYLKTIDPELYVEVYLENPVNNFKDYRYLDINNPSHIEVIGNTLFIGGIINE